MSIVNQVADAYLGTASGSSAERLRFLKGLWEIQSQIESVERPYEALDAEAVRKTLLSGRPLFLVSSPSLPVAEYVGAVSRIAAYAADNAGLVAEQAEALRSIDFGDFISEGQLAAAATAPQAFVSAVLDALAAEEVPVEPATVVFVLVSALVPFMVGPAKRTLDAFGAVDRAVWNTGNCPVCGSPASAGSLGESTSSQGAERTLWCGMCHTEWVYDRIRCVRCGTQNPHNLRYTHVEGDPAHRLHLCDECHGYVKIVSEGDLGKDLCLLVEEAVMATLDAVAIEKGYSAIGDGGVQAC